MLKCFKIGLIPVQTAEFEFYTSSSAFVILYSLKTPLYE